MQSLHLPADSSSGEKAYFNFWCRAKGGPVPEPDISLCGCAKLRLCLFSWSSWTWQMTLLPHPLPLYFKHIDPALNFPNLRSLPAIFYSFPASCLCWGVQHRALSWLTCSNQYWSGISNLISVGLSLSFFRSKRNHLIFSPDSSSAWIMIKIVLRDVSVWLPFKRWGDAAATSRNIKSRRGIAEVPLDHSKALPSLSFCRIKLRKDLGLLLLLYCSSQTAEYFVPAIVGFCY